MLAVSLCHMLNDIMQSMLAAIYPLLKEEFALTYGQIGFLTLAFQVTASLLQPLVGAVADRHPQPRALPLSSAFTLGGLVLLATAPNFPLLVAGACMIGVGSSIFHPESSKVARLASGGRYGLAQSTFQVGGNFGTAIGPVLAAFIVVPMGRGSVIWFCLLALVGMLVLTRVSGWYARTLVAARSRPPADKTLPYSGGRILVALVVLALLMFSKNAYSSVLTNYHTFYMIETFGLTTQQSQLMLFLFLLAMAIGTFIGGPVGDRFGPMVVIWMSILGVLPLTLLLPHANLVGTGVLTMLIGVLMAGSFPAIVVMAQELLPGRVGLVSGVFYGLSFGFGGLAAAGFGLFADQVGLETVYAWAAWLPALGVLAILLPKRSKRRAV